MRKGVPSELVSINKIFRGVCVRLYTVSAATGSVFGVSVGVWSLGAVAPSSPPHFFSFWFSFRRVAE